jgi:amino acid permease
MEQHLISYYIGILIIFLINAYILFQPDQTMMTVKQYASLNLAGAFFIAYYFLYKENKISF